MVYWGTTCGLFQKMGGQKRMFLYLRGLKLYLTLTIFTWYTEPRCLHSNENSWHNIYPHHRYMQAVVDEIVFSNIDPLKVVHSLQECVYCYLPIPYSLFIYCFNVFCSIHVAGVWVISWKNSWQLGESCCMVGSFATTVVLDFHQHKYFVLFIFCFWFSQLISLLLILVWSSVF